MGSRFKLRISRMFRASFNSCRSRNDAQEPIFFHRHFHPLQSCRIFDPDGLRCPPASPENPLNTDLKLREFKGKEKERRKKKMKETKNEGKEAVDLMLWSSSSADTRGFFSSHDEREDDERKRLFSSKSFSSDSSELHLRSRSNRTRKARRRKIHIRSSDMCFELSDSISNSIARDKIQDSVAVVKTSNDPYGDFRRSMVEMIIEKQIFAAKDLEQLLHSFLYLNSVHHHQAIVEVFLEIWEALFTIF